MTTAVDDAFLEGFHDLPNEKQRASLSVVQLAELLAPLKADSVPYIVPSHELNVKIAERQASIANRGIKIAGAFTLLGSVLGAWATSWFTSQPAAQVVHCECGPNSTAKSAQAASAVGNPLSSVVPDNSTNTIVVPTTKPAPTNSSTPNAASAAK